MGAIEMRAIKVVEIPPEASVALVEELLNGPDHGSYYLHSLLGRYAIFQLRTHAIRTAQSETERAGRSDEDDEAKAFIRDNPHLSVREATAELAARGVKRGKSKVAQLKAEVCGTGTSITAG